MCTNFLDWVVWYRSRRENQPRNLLGQANKLSAPIQFLWQMIYFNRLVRQGGTLAIRQLFGRI